MKVYRTLSALPSFENTIITIGSFDGVHTGHQKILDKIKQLSLNSKVENVVITFDPHPRAVVFPKDKTLRLLNTLDEKLELFRKHGIDNVVVVPFTVEFSQISPEEYIQDFLVKYFNPKTIVIGYDHRFGKNRAGDIRLLKSVKDKYNFNIEEITKQEVDEITISSTKIRNAIQSGELSTANALLNYPYKISGTVVSGRKLGTEIGFPTANVSVKDPLKLIPKDGIYVCTVSVKDKTYNGMLYIGDIPTVGIDNPKSIEVNIFDFEDDIYDQEIVVNVLHYLRDDEKFDGINALKAQLQIDRENSLAYFDALSKEESRTTVAILNYNTVDYLDQFLPTVQYSSKNEFDILVIDNASHDSSVEFIKEWYPEIKLKRLDKNYGFAEGYNKGLADTNTKYVVLLNSDVEVTEGWLDPIIEYMDAEPDVGAAMPKILSYNDTDSFEYAGAAGGYIDKLGYPFCRGRIFDTVEEDHGQYDDVQEIFWASGAALVIRTELYKSFKGLDKDYFAHQEEIDLCWRLKNAGHKIVVVPQSTVYHVGGGSLDYSSPRKVYLNFRNNLMTIFKNERASKLLWLLPVRMVLDFVAALKFIFSGQFKHGFNVLKSGISFITKIPQLIGKRKKISKVNSNPKGIYNKSIVFQYYLHGKKKYSDL